MNDCEFVGNLVKDPVLRQPQTGKAVVSFTIATNEDYVTPQGEKKQLTDYINVVAWGNLAQAAGQQLHKGMRVLIHGRQSTRSYQGQDGQKRWTTEINASLIAIPLSTQQGQHGGQYPQQSPQAQGGGWSQFGQTSPQATGVYDEQIPF